MDSAPALTANSLTPVNKADSAPWLASHRFKPGQSGNPSGRPKKVTNAVDKALTLKRARRVADALIAKAEEGSVQAFEAIRDTIEGPLPRPVQLSGADGGPILIAQRLLLGKERMAKINAEGDE